MKKQFSIFFALIMLLSSGLIQFVVHVCPLDGAALSSSACHSHDSQPADDCCDEGNGPVDSEDCCKDQFVFAVSAKFGGITAFECPLPNYVLTKNVFELSEFQASILTNGLSYGPRHGPPLQSGQSILTKNCIYRI